MKPSEDENGAQERVIFAEESTEGMSDLNRNLPGTIWWLTKDLSMPHPKNSNLRSYYGPRDDNIVLSNSKNLDLVSMELMVEGHPLLADALVMRNGRVRVSLLLEPKEEIDAL